MDDPLRTELDGANVQSCFRNAEFGDDDHSFPSEVKLKIPNISLTDQKTVKTKLKENSSSEETVHVDVGRNAVACIRQA